MSIALQSLPTPIQQADIISLFEPPKWLLDVQAIYMEPAVTTYRRGREILDHFPNAERIEVQSHWKIPGLFGSEGNIADWNKIKRNTLVLGVKKSLRAEPNSRSSDF